VIRWLGEFFDEVAHELRLIWRMFLQPSTWIVIAVLAAFGVVMFFGMRIALRYDGLMHLLGVQLRHCRTLSNPQYLGLMYMLFFFAIAMVYCLGNLANYLGERGKGRYGRESRRLAVHALLGGIAALLVGGGATAILAYWC